MLVPKNATTIRCGKFRGYVPATWNDLPNELLLPILAIITLSGQERALTQAELIPYLRLNILAVLLHTDLDLLFQEVGAGADAGAEEREIAMADLQPLLDLITFPFYAPDPEKPTQLAVHFGLTRCPFPAIQSPGGYDWAAPSDALANITIWELAYVLPLADDYGEQRNDETLCLLLAALYRQQKCATPENLQAEYHGDIRVPLYRSEHLVAVRAREWRRAPHIVKQALWFWFSSCRQAIVQNPSFAILFESTGGKEDPYGWAGTLLHLAGNQVMNMDRLADVPYDSALLQLAREKYQAQEMETQRKRRKQ